MYTKKFINITSLIITIIIFVFINNLVFSPKEVISDTVEMHENENLENVNTINNQEVTIEETDAQILGKIIIPVINLEAEIKEGTTSKIINNYVGHFENTSLDKGNIGLAAHNRGQTVKAYFQNIKKLKKGDEIIYKTSNFERKYIVEKVIIIKETNWKYLENTTDNRITLITCVENEPQYRLCVQGIEKLN